MCGSLRCHSTYSSGLLTCHVLSALFGSAQLVDQSMYQRQSPMSIQQSTRLHLTDWYPDASQNTPPERINRWAADTLTHLLAIFFSPDAASELKHKLDVKAQMQISLQKRSSEALQLVGFCTVLIARLQIFHTAQMEAQHN